MIEVIKHGNKTIGPITYRFTCWHCGCVYDADNKDSGVGYHKGGMGHFYARCNCPECGYVNSVDTYVNSTNMESVTNET